MGKWHESKIVQKRELKAMTDTIEQLTRERDELVEALSGFKPRVEGRRNSHTYSDSIISRAARVLAKHSGEEK